MRELTARTIIFRATSVSNYGYTIRRRLTALSYAVTYIFRFKRIKGEEIFAWSHFETNLNPSLAISLTSFHVLPLNKSAVSSVNEEKCGPQDTSLKYTEIHRLQFTHETLYANTLRSFR